MRYFVGFLVLLGVVLGNENQAYIQIFDFIDQNWTSPKDPMVVLTEDIGDDLLTKPKIMEFDLWDSGHMEARNRAPIEAGEYLLSLQRNTPGEVAYVQKLGSFSVKNGESAAILVDEKITQDSAGEEKRPLIGTICHTGPIPKPGLDQAVVILCSANERIDVTKIDVTGYNLGCKGCQEHLPITTDPVEDSVQFLIDDTNYKWNVSISIGALTLCDLTLSLGDGGVYTVVVKTAENNTNPLINKYECFLGKSTDPSNFWLPIWLPILILVVFIVLVLVLIIVNKRYPMIREKLLGRSDPDPEVKEEKKSTRLNSLDTFRGLAITIMIFVNFGGGKYYFLEHAAWHGLSLADFVFPWFMFMVGVSIVLSVQSQLKRNTPKTEILKKVTIRFIKLYLIGLFLNTGIPGGVELSIWRIPGVLQRIGFTFFVCAVLEILFIPRLTPSENYGGEPMTVDNEYNECGKFINDEPDIPEKKISNWKIGVRPDGESSLRGSCFTYLTYHTWPQWVVMALITGIWCAITFAMPIPGCPTGYVGPGGIADQAKYPNCTGGAAGYIDRLVFGNNMYSHPTCKLMYKTTLPYDPEGILGSLMAIATVYSGVIAGHIVVMLKSSRGKLMGTLGVLGVVGTVIALILSKASIDGGWVPINKNLWTVSFVAATSASSYFILALTYFLVDYHNIWCGVPFSAAGRNPLFLYCGSYILYNYFPFNWSTSSTHGMLMLQALVGTISWILVGLYLDCKKKYYKI